MALPCYCSSGNSVIVITSFIITSFNITSLLLHLSQNESREITLIQRMTSQLDRHHPKDNLHCPEMARFEATLAALWPSRQPRCCLLLASDLLIPSASS